MQLKEFLTDSSTLLKNNSALLFCGSNEADVPIIFASQVMKQLKSENYHIESIDLATCSLSNVLSQLETSFLGMSLVYWLQGIQDIDKKHRQKLFEHLNNYTGPHQIIGFITQQEAQLFSKKIVVTIPEVINPLLFSSLFTFFKKKMGAQTSKLIQNVCNEYDTISLDQACMVIAYMQVIGKAENWKQLFENILESEKSLFTLSQSFFAKEPHAFFHLWHHFESKYPMTFWCTFWSEQLWRAYHVCYFLDRQQQQQAKSIGFRLPFTFLQKDWKKSTLSELKNAHQFVYELDLNFKNNIETEAGIDLFFTKFFLNEF